MDSLLSFGLQWDAEIYYQSQHLADYQRLLQQLLNQHQLYACRCSRKTLANQDVYPGFCRNQDYVDDHQTALRLRIQPQNLCFNDALQGSFAQNLADVDGDFIVRRKDQIVAYQFAVVVDDFAQGVTHVVRGVDLLDSTPKQIYLQQILGYSTPRYSHLPVIVDTYGKKLSKQTLATPVDSHQPAAALFLILQLLGQNPPANLSKTSVSEQLNWAIAHWQPQLLKKIRAIVSPIL